MQLSNAPAKLFLPFADAGGKNTIPVNSQVGITPGAASLTDGFPPLTRTPIAAGGVPPSGLDMNGVLNAATAANRWANAGAGYVYDGTFAANANVGGYPKGARVLRTDGEGYWLNTADDNATDPEAGGAGWVPDFTSGTATIAMASANVTLTSLQAGRPIVTISGTLTANLNLVFPAYVKSWIVVNNATGAYTVTCKTAAGTGVAVGTGTQATIVGDGTNIAGISAVVTAASDPTFADSSVKPASTNWIRGAMLAIATAAGFAASFAVNGYIKFPSWLGGWVVNWGGATTSGGAAAVTFSLAFPTALYQVFAVQGPNGTAGNATVDTASWTTTGFSAFTFLANTGAATNRSIAWFAVGK